MSLGLEASQPNPPQQVPAQQNTSAILAALANMARQNTAAPPAPGTPAQASMNNVLGTQHGLSQPAMSSVDQGSSATNGQAVNPFGALFAGMSNGAQNQSHNQIPTIPPQNPLAAFLPQAQVPAVPLNAPVGPDAQQQLQLLQLLASQGIPPDQWATALRLLNLQGAGGANLNVGGLPSFSAPPPANGWSGRNDGSSRDRDGAPDYTRSPNSQYRRRSRSPGWDRRREVSPPRRRDSPVYGEYRGDRNRDDRDGRGGRRGNDYRQRSPPGRRRRSPTPPRKDQPLPPPGQKNIQFDQSIGKGNIKVLSRTLFVGGVTSSEAHLRSLFSNFGIVQTCIVNTDKRHAFVKMIDRKDAIAARDGMEQYRSGEMQLRVSSLPYDAKHAALILDQTRWGVGFGPRDCSDYQTGVSVIPVDRLTDADRKWMLSAEYGGTGGRPIESGMVVEEPDIEIGAGVSSKGMSASISLTSLPTASVKQTFALECEPLGSSHSLSCVTTSILSKPPSTSAFVLIALSPTAISRRMATDQGGKRGPQSSRVGNHGSSRSDRFGRVDDDYQHNIQDNIANNTSISGGNPNNIGVPPPVPGFGFTFPTLPNGMPMFPPGFMMPTPQPQHQQQQQQGSGQE